MGTAVASSSRGSTRAARRRKITWSKKTPQDGLNKDGMFFWKSDWSHQCQQGFWAGGLAAPGAEDAGCDPAGQIPSSLPLPSSVEHPWPSRAPWGPSSYPGPLRVLGNLLCSSLALWHWASPSPLLGCGQSFPSAINPHFIITLMTILA